MLSAILPGMPPVLEPNPQNGQKKLLQFFGVIVAILVFISVLASIASRMG